MRCARIWFEKKGEIKYISHLDLMRCFTRAIKRAKIPLWFTEGYNPRAYMQFALPLSLGMESVCESVDIRIEGEMSDEELLKRLKENMPEGINITKITEPEYNPKVIAFGKFEIRFFGVRSPFELLKTIESLLNSDSLTVEKSGKQGRKKVMKQINLIEHIKSFCAEKTDENEVKLTIVLPAGSVTNINPSLVSDKILEVFGEQISFSITRLELMLDSLKVFR